MQLSTPRIELGRISAIAQELGVTQDIYMRITPGIEADTHEFIRTGCEDSKFGFYHARGFRLQMREGCFWRRRVFVLPACIAILALRFCPALFRGH